MMFQLMWIPPKFGQVSNLMWTFQLDRQIVRPYEDFMMFIQMIEEHLKTVLTPFTTCLGA